MDSSVIYALNWMRFQKNVLIDDLREVRAGATMKLFKESIDEYPHIILNARKQVGDSDYYSSSLHIDNLIGPDKSISELFTFLRVVNCDRYPVFFNKLDRVHKINLEKFIK